MTTRGADRWRAMSSLTAVCAFCALVPSLPRVPAADTAAAEHYRQALRDAKRELEVERERFAREAAAAAGELAAQVEKAHRLSDELVDRNLVLTARRAELEARRGEVAELRQSLRRSQTAWTEIGELVGAAHGQLGGLLDSLPLSENRARQREALASLEVELESGRRELASLFEIVRSLIDESASCAVYEGDVRTSRGEPTIAEILRVGAVFCAWRTRQPAAVAVALRAPFDERGFRWDDEIPTVAREQVIAAIEAAGRGDGALVVPIDVSQRMAVGQRYGRPGGWERLVAGGPVMIPLAAVAVVAALLLIERFLFLARQGRNPRRLVRAVFASCADGDFRGAEQRAARARGPTARALEACLQGRTGGVRAMEDGIETAMLGVLPGLERFLPLIGLLSTIAPLLGLLGTVTGIITSFEGMTAMGSSEPSVLAGGISEALVTTATGLVIAIPVLLLHGMVAARGERLVSDAERFAANLLAELRDAGGSSATERSEDGGGDHGPSR